MPTENTVTKVAPANLAVFDEVRAGIALYKEENASLEFDYEDPAGEKEARSHVYKLRQAKGKVVAIHKEAKAEALAACRAIDAEKNTLIADVEEMIDVHIGPIKAIEERKQEEIRAKAAAEQAEKDRIEQERLDAIAEHEERLALKEAEFARMADLAAMAEQERLAKIYAEESRIAREREKLEAEKQAEAEAKRREEEAKKQAEIDKREALERAEREKQEAIEVEREKARREAEAKVEAEAERIAAERAEQQRLEEIECKRQANKKHRDKIDKEVVGIFTEFEMPPAYAKTLTAEISRGVYPSLTINY